MLAVDLANDAFLDGGAGFDILDGDAIDVNVNFELLD